MPYKKTIDKVLKLLGDAADELGGMALIGNLSGADQTYISQIHMDIREAMEELDEFGNDVHNIWEDEENED
jgi:hypothetical protein